MYKLKSILTATEGTIEFEYIIRGIDVVVFLAKTALYLKIDEKIFLLQNVASRYAVLSYDDSWLAVLTAQNEILIFELKKFEVTLIYHICSKTTENLTAMIFTADKRQLICAIAKQLYLEVYTLRPEQNLLKLWAPQNLCPLPEPVNNIRFAGETVLISISSNNRIFATTWQLVEDTSPYYPEGTRLPFVTEILDASHPSHTTPTLPPSNLIFYKMGFLICTFTSGHLFFCEIQKINRILKGDIHKFTPLNLFFFPRIDDIFENEIHPGCLSIALSDFSIGRAVLWEFEKIGIAWHAKCKAVFAIDLNILSAARFSGIPKKVNDETIYEGKLPLLTLVTNESETPPLTAYQANVLTLNLRTLTAACLPIKILLTNYDLTAAFMLHKLHIKNIFFVAGQKLRLQCYLSNSENSIVIYAEFEIDPITFQIEKYLEDETYATLMKIAGTQNDRHRLILPRGIKIK